MDTKQSETPEQRPTTTRSEAMRKAWEKRRATAALEKESLAHPVCSCGCGARIEIAKNPEKQRYFKPGHDSALKSLLRKINRGEAKPEDIPQAARANVARIKFIQANPEFQKVFAKSSQPQRRQPKAATGDSVTSETGSRMTILKQLARQAIRYGLKPEDIGPVSTTFTDDEYMRCYIGHLRGLESPASFGVSAVHRDRARREWRKLIAKMKQGAAK